MRQMPQIVGSSTKQDGGGATTPRHPLCDFSAPARRTLEAISAAVLYPKGTILFAEGQPAKGVYFLMTGRVKLITTSVDGRTLVVRVAAAGGVIGLPATLRQRPYEATAEVLEPTEARFVNRHAFHEFLDQHPEAAIRLAQILCDVCRDNYQRLRDLGFPASAERKLARLLLDGSVAPSGGSGRMTMTHEQIAEMIGTSRETVTRMMTAFRRLGLFAPNHHGTLLDRVRLHELSGGG